MLRAVAEGAFEMSITKSVIWAGAFFGMSLIPIFIVASILGFLDKIFCALLRLNRIEKHDDKKD